MNFNVGHSRAACAHLSSVAGTTMSSTAQPREVRDWRRVAALGAVGAAGEERRILAQTGRTCR